MVGTAGNNSTLFQIRRLYVLYVKRHTHHSLACQRVGRDASAL